MGLQSKDADAVLRRRRALALAAALAVTGLPWGGAAAAESPADEAATVAAVNSRFNALEQRSDVELWGRREHWATPAEFLARGGGDCEDFAVAKYFALLAAGVPEDRLHLGLARLLRRAPVAIEDHLVLLWSPRPGAEPLVLDNVEPRVLPLAQRADLSVQLAFNRSAAFAVVGTRLAPERPRQPPRRWGELLARMAAPPYAVAAH